MPNKRVNNTEPRARLNRPHILQTALTLADQDGLASLSMRKLAQALQVEAMSIYHHVTNKEDLLDGLVDLVFAEIQVPDPQHPWKTALRERAASAHAALMRHPWAVGLMETRTAPGPHTLHHHNAVLGCLRQSGFNVAATAHAYSLLDSYIYGFALQQINLPFNTADEAAPVADTMMANMPTDAYPYLTEMALEHVMQPGYQYAHEFEIGLDLVLNSIETLRGT